MGGGRMQGGGVGMGLSLGVFWFFFFFGQVGKEWCTGWLLGLGCGCEAGMEVGF